MEIPVQKNKEYIVDIIDNGIEGEGIAKIENFAIFIDGAIKGEKCRILIVKITSSHAFGKLLEVIEPSEFRCQPDCDSYKRCGGCNLRHIEYEETLNIKAQKVQNLVNKTLSNSIDVYKTLGMGNPYNYRNKAQYPVGINKDGEIVMGVFAKRTHEIIPLNECYIQKEISYKIAKFIIDYMKENGISVYNEETQKGLVRHIVTKVGVQTNEIMCIIVINGKEIPNEKDLTDKIIQNFPEVKSIVKNINTRNTNIIMGEQNVNLYGNGYITDILGDYTFKISPMSFYQVNPVQAEALYNIAIEKANITKNDVVCDLYCGIGTIGIFASKFAKKVYGIELVKQAIDDANANANLNNIDNIEFICGDVEEAFDRLIKKEKVKPSVVIVDPPRRGLDNNTIENIMQLNVERVIYISCNPATMVRDLHLMEEKYEVKEIQPVDMFPFTSHVETVTVLTLKNQGL